MIWATTLRNWIDKSVSVLISSLSLSIWFLPLLEHLLWERQSWLASFIKLVWFIAQKKKHDAETTIAKNSKSWTDIDLELSFHYTNEEKVPKMFQNMGAYQGASWVGTQWGAPFNTFPTNVYIQIPWRHHAHAQLI